jgi:hypothetical protein
MGAPDDSGRKALRRLWWLMIDRCTNPDRKHFARYGGRGIKVCDRWQASFDAFRVDMGPRPTGWTLEREDNNGNYEPGNCVWATRKRQQNNRHNNFFLQFGGERLTLTQLSERAGINVYTLRERLKSGLSPEEAVAMPVRVARKAHPITRDDRSEIVRRRSLGESYRVIARAIGCDNSAVCRALKTIGSTGAP